MQSYCRFLATAVFLLVGIFVALESLILTPTLGVAGQGNADLLQQAQAYEDQQNYPAAENVYRAMLASEPDNPEALKHFGILEQTELKFEESIKHFKRVLKDQPEYPQVNFFLGLSYYAQHNYQNAVTSFQQELKTPTAHPATGYYLALALEGEGRMDEAIDRLNQVAAKNPNKSDVFFELARLHMNATFVAVARLRKIDPDSFQIHALMGDLYSQEGHYESAITQFQAALKKQPDAPGIHSPLGVAYFMTNHHDLAEQELLLALKESPDDSLANLYLGDMALHLNQFTKALPYLKQAVSGRPNDVESRLLLARCYLQLDDPKHARATLLETATLDPADPRSHYMLATVYQKLNQPADRQHELDLFNQLSAAQKVKGSDDSGAKPADDPAQGAAHPQAVNP